MPFLIPLIGLVAGILAGTWLDGPAWGIIPVAFAVLTYCMILRKSYIPLKAVKLNSRHSIWIFLLFCGIGIFTSWFHSPASFEPLVLQSFSGAEGEVVDAATLTTGDRYTVDVSRLVDNKGNVTDCRNLRIILKTDGLSASVGDLILFPVALEEIEDNENHAASGYKKRMQGKGILYSSYCPMEKVKFKAASRGIRGKSAKWRDRIEIAIEKSQLNRNTAHFLISILLGDRTFIKKEIKDAFSDSGVAHVLALSGMHVAIIMGIFLFILFPLKLAGLGKTRLWIAVAMIWGYAFFTGLAPATVRACIMTTFLAGAMSLQRRNISANALLASAFVILLMNPYAIADPGMRLSFLCVAAILTFAGPLNTVNHHLHPRLHALNASLLVTLVSTLATWVLVSYYFKRIPVLFLPSNLLILPILPVFLSISLLYIGLLSVGIDLAPLAWILDAAFDTASGALSWLSSFGNATIDYQATLPIVIIWLLGVLIAGYAMTKKKTKSAFCVAGAMCACSIALIPILKSPQKDGMIFQRKYYDISMALYNSDKEDITSFPRNTVSHILHKGTDIISIDCRADLDSLAAVIAKGKRARRRYMILGSGFKGLKIEEIPSVRQFDKIILHSSMRKSMEKEITDEAIKAGINRLHSLRREGALEIEL